MRAKEFIIESMKKKGTCLKCSDGHKGGNYFDLTYDWGFDEPDYDENAPPKVNWVCRNCGHNIPAKQYNTAKKKQRQELIKLVDEDQISEYHGNERAWKIYSVKDGKYQYWGQDKDKLKALDGLKQFKRHYRGKYDSWLVSLRQLDEDQINELAWDDQNGKGITPNNREIDYIGMRVLMKPEDFLRLAQSLPVTPKEKEKIEAMIQSGVAFAPPWLKISVPNEWKAFDQPPEVRFAKYGEVIEHEGRHRMLAHLWEVGNEPVEVHVVLQSPGKEWRTRNWANDNKNDYSKEVVSALNTTLKNEDGKLLSGPFFHYEGSYEE